MIKPSKNFGCAQVYVSSIGPKAGAPVEDVKEDARV